MEMEGILAEHLETGNVEQWLEKSTSRYINVFKWIQKNLISIFRDSSWVACTPNDGE